MPAYARTWSPRLPIDGGRARLVSRDAGSKRQRGSGRSIETVGGFARYVLLIGGNRDQRREHRGLDLRNARRQCAQADQSTALPVGALAIRDFRMFVPRAPPLDARFSLLTFAIHRTPAPIVIPPPNPRPPPPPTRH